LKLLKSEKIKTLQLKININTPMATGSITEEAIQKLIQDALAAQADTHRTELAALSARFQNSSASAAPTTPASFPDGFINSFNSSKNSFEYGVSFTRLQRIRRHVHIGYVQSCCGSSIRFGPRIFLFDFPSGGFL